MGQCQQHKIWAQAKDIASRLYNQGLPKDDYLGQSGGTEKQTYPLRFDGGLGKQLDAFIDYHDKLRKETDKNSAKLPEMEKEMQKRADVVVEQVKTYLRHCAGHREELDKVDGKIFLLLEKTLKSIGSAILKLRNIQFQSAQDPVMIAKVYQGHHTRWQDAKSASESAFKKALKDKETGKALKEAKKDSYPLKFKGGMGPCLENLARNMKVLDTQEARKIMEELAKITGEYLRLVKSARSDYKDAGFKGKPFDEVFEPLESALVDIESDATT